MIDGLWVAEQLRGRGLGRRLLVAAEAAAIKRGCRGAWLGTFDFQSRGFYERLGYTVFAELADFPDGHSRGELLGRLRLASLAARRSAVENDERKVQGAFRGSGSRDVDRRTGLRSGDALRSRRVAKTRGGR